LVCSRCESTHRCTLYGTPLCPHNTEWLHALTQDLQPLFLDMLVNEAGIPCRLPCCSSCRCSRGRRRPRSTAGRCWGPPACSKYQRHAAHWSMPSSTLMVDAKLGLTGVLL
jgi:hypothetical protein